MSNKYIHHLEWTNEKEFCDFLDRLKDTHTNSDPFEEWFTFKFRDGSEQRFRLLFNQKDGFSFT